jgi:uncharacterized OB-fold protein
MAERRPNRTLGAPHDEFWAHCNERELHIQRCAGCGTYAWPPVRHCEECNGTELVWTKTVGTGELVSWCVFHQPYHREMTLPYDTVLVELTEGPLFVSNPLGFGHDDMTRGLRVEVDFLQCEDDAGPFLLPIFRRA